MSEIIILDTHIWIWYINRELDQFPTSWLEIIETANQVRISPVSCYEVALAQQRGRLLLPSPVNQWFQEALEPSGISLLPLTPAIASSAVNLSPIHRDPFDRIIIATAIEYQAKLASIDGFFRQYPGLATLLMI
ncbi:type II toxin-antitoxin system VapC family toxin [Nostoc sp. UCD121]|uniref:type II toxin-antitoxin system VapC family toxin n=1 Tax=unclassified Nostoc TaxID=2593658 RepID=UPI001628DAD1|nr:MULTISPECIES: PIN domain-containing protein [unclassified Nostoc]MBC1223489.1 type II toxin-antitoxin system VapC family toxin [Nostoc sp. UCD120]MBC1274959.1 type II toxin-antitoxin system VapC family toxin [Nostoc sp. UCD121]MBC1297411.1 type II toxin-antitoxin system VapC family toxin [Nostoc sp. UCD122]